MGLLVVVHIISRDRVVGLLEKTNGAERCGKRLVVNVAFPVQERVCLLIQYVILADLC
jgi:hypothetical protein